MINKNLTKETLLITFIQKKIQVNSMAIYNLFQSIMTIPESLIQNIVYIYFLLKCIF